MPKTTKQRGRRQARRLMSGRNGRDINNSTIEILKLTYFLPNFILPVI